MTTEQYNGWTNWNTWNAYNLATMDAELCRHYEILADTYPTAEALAKAIELTLFEQPVVIRHVEPEDTEDINWVEVAEAFME